MEAKNKPVVIEIALSNRRHWCGKNGNPFRVHVQTVHSIVVEITVCNSTAGVACIAIPEGKPMSPVVVEFAPVNPKVHALSATR